MAFTAAILIRTAFPGFGALEIGQHVRVTPAGEARLAPVVIIAPVAAHMGHGVDRRRTAQHLAAQGLDPPVVEIGLGLGVVAPIVAPVGPQLADAKRNMDEGIAVARACLDQQHRCRRVLAQPIGEHATRRTAADDDVIIARRHGVSFSHPAAE